METNTTHPSSGLNNQWPGAFGLVKPAREAMMRNLSTMIMLVLTTGLLSLVLNILLRRNDWQSIVISELISFVVSAIIACAEIVTVLASLRGKQIDYNQAFKLGYPMWWKMLLLNIVVGLTVVGGLILLIVPGVYFALRLSLAQYYLVDRQMGVMEAYKASWHATKGHVGKVWGIIGVMFLMVLPIVTIIGILATIYLLFMFWPAMAMLYMYVSSRHQAASASVEPQTAA